MTEKSGSSFLSSFSTISKVITALISLPIIGLVVLIVYFNYNKENITNSIVNLVNTKIQGEFKFNKVRFSPLAQFPHVSISIDDVSYYDEIQISNDTTMDKILDIESVSLAFNILSLLSDNIKVYGIEFENGNIDLIRYSDSTMNFIAALQSMDKQPEENIMEKDSLTQNSSFIRLSLDYIALENIGFKFTDKVTKKDIHFHINSVHSKYVSTDETIDFQVDSDLHLYHLPLYDNFDITNSNLLINADMKWTVPDSILHIEMANIEIDKSKFKSSGFINLGSSKYLSLDLSLFDNDLSVTNFILSQKGIENIDKGSVYFDGKITHNFIDEIPGIDCKFGFNDIRISDPSTKNYIEDLFLEGSFNTGNKRKMSDAILRIDTLYAQLPNGNINASLDIKNFVLPEFNSSIDLAINLKGFDELFGQTYFVNPQGNLVLNLNLAGSKTSDTTWAIDDGNQLYIMMDNISYDIPDILELKKLNGTISGSIDLIELKNLDIIAGNSDFNINGDILSIMNLVMGGVETPTARLKIKSNNFDLPESMSWIPTVREDFRDQFPYSIINIDVEAIATITKESLINSTIMPEMHIDVPYCFAQVDEFLPPVKVSNGFLHFAEVGSGYSIDINDFDIEFEKASLYGGCTYYYKRGEYDSLDIKADIRSFYPNYILNYYSNDSNSIMDSTNIVGDVKLQMNFSGFDTIREKTFASIELKQMEVINPNDTILCENLHIDVGEVYYDSYATFGPLSVLSSDILMSIDNLTSTNIDLQEITTHILVEDGEFDINILNSSSLLQAGTGKLIIAPFVEIPYFQLNYSLDVFRFEDLFERLNQPPVVKGSLGVSINLEGKGKGWENLSESLNGQLNVDGEQLKLMGINLDNVIRKLNRTQNFSLIDIGAIVVAGPFGLLVTKGADVSFLLINNRKDSTEIVKLISEWKIVSGIMELDDVAFSTPKNRVAAKGKYSFPSDSIAIVIAVVDEKGKIELHQTISGTSSESDFGEIRPLKALLKPVGNLFDDILFIEGETFYDGKVKPPEK